MYVCMYGFYDTMSLQLKQDSTDVFEFGRSSGGDMMALIPLKYL